MGAYNRVNGESASASPRLLQDILRKEWGFDGYVVSDCGAIDDVYTEPPDRGDRGGRGRAGRPRGAATSSAARTYKALRAALDKGLVKESDIDVAVTRRLMPPACGWACSTRPSACGTRRSRTPSTNRTEHDQLARRAAQESIVLLKNDGVLPLPRTLRTIAVIGPNADEIMTLLGNYYGTACASRDAAGGDDERAWARAPGCLYARGADLVEGRQDPRAVPAHRARASCVPPPAPPSTACAASTSAGATSRASPS